MRNHRLRILVCKPRLARQTIKLNRFIGCEPLELEFLYSVLQQHDITLLDGMVDRRNPVRLARQLGTQIVLLTSFITTISVVMKIAARLKALPNPPLIFVGGPHAEVVPEDFYSPFIDGVFFADQLNAIAHVIDCIQQKKSYQHVPGAAFPIDGEFVRNPSPPLDPVTLPKIKHILLEKFPQRYKIIYYKPCGAIKTAFGCPERCTFCFCAEMHGGTYACRPVEDVVDEIEQIPAKNIIILDDDFLISKTRLLQFCELVKSRKLKKEFIAIGNARFIARHPDVLRQLRQAGVAALMVGFEFVTDKELGAVHKKASVADNTRTIDICRKLDIDLFALFIINPDWQYKDFRRLARYLREHSIPFALFSTLTIFPGTTLAHLKSVEQPNITKWWRYDLLRLHQKPRHMSSLMYYLWLFYLYMIPGLKFTTLKKFRQRYGLWGIVSHSALSFFSGMEYLIKLLIWR